jgi:hypothetical protein
MGGDGPPACSYAASVIGGRIARRVAPLVVVSVIASTLVLVAVAGGSAAPPQAPGKRDRGAVIAYWTAERVARAVPREVSPDRLPSFTPQAGKPPNTGGGGGGGSSGTSVTGAAWTGGGKVKATTGKVLFTMAGVDYVCSGSVAQDANTTTSLILTAGHCVYDETGGAFATNWMFVPDYENGGAIITNPDGSHSFTCDTAPYGCWTASALVTTTAWANGGGSLAGFNNDYAFAVVGPGGKTDESRQLDAVVGDNAIAFDVSHPTQVYSFGYPQASPYDGQKLIYCAGNDVADTWGGTTDFGLNCNMTGGSSGGPWFVNFASSGGAGALNSVNSFKYTFGKLSKYMFGPYFGAYALKTYNAAKTATGDLTVAP